MKREIILAKNAIKPLQKEARSQDTNMSIQVGLYIHIENVILSLLVSTKYSVDLIIKLQT